MGAYKSNIGPQEGCQATSSNCVIWQGPDISCLNICKGDSITDVTYKLATAFCALQSASVDLCGYDITDCDIDYDCLSSPGTIVTLKDLLERIITDLCAIDTGAVSAVVVPLPVCLQYDDGFGQAVTSLELDEWAQLINDKICEIETDIETLQTTVATHTTDISDHETRITDLEALTYAPLLITQTASDPTPGVGTINFATSHTDLADQFIDLQDSTGDPAGIAAAVADQTTANGDTQLAAAPAVMSSLAGWEAAPATMAESLTNVWLTIGDIRDWAATVECDTVPVTLSTFVLSSAIVANDVQITATWVAPASSSTRTGYTVTLHKNGALVSSHSEAAGATSRTWTLADADRNNLFTVVIKVIYDCGESESVTQAIKPTVTPVTVTITESLQNTTYNGCAYLSVSGHLALTPAGTSGDDFVSVWNPDHDGKITIQVDLDIYQCSLVCPTNVTATLTNTTSGAVLMTLTSAGTTKGVVTVTTNPGENINITLVFSACS